MKSNQWKHTIFTRAAETKTAVICGPGVAESSWSGRSRAALPAVRIRARPSACCASPSLPSSAGGGQRPGSSAQARCGRRAAWANARLVIASVALKTKRHRQKSSFKISKCASESAFACVVRNCLYYYYYYYFYDYSDYYSYYYNDY